MLVLQILIVVADALASQSMANFHVIGVGYGRTGTDSLREALNLLGYKTFHTKEMFESPSLLQHFDDAVFRFDHAQLRLPDFSLVAQAGFNASMDMPMSLYYEHLYMQNPTAKFILSIRKSPEVWLRSWRSLISAVSLLPRFAPFLPRVPMIDRYNRWLMALLHQDDAFLTMPHPQVTEAQDDRAAHSYEEHNAGVRRVIPPSQLLEIDLADGEGWGPLCRFLHLQDNECPSAQGVPFPRVNSQMQMRRQLQAVVVIANCMLVLAVGLVLFLLRAIAQRLQDAVRRPKRE